MLSVLRRKAAVSPWVGLLARRGQAVSLPAASPSPAIEAEWLIEATRPHLQWRNRAGFAPDFPVMPVVGTQGAEVGICITRHGSCRGCARSRASLTILRSL